MNKKLIVSGVAAAVVALAAYFLAQTFLFGDSAVARAEAQFAAAPRAAPKTPSKPHPATRVGYLRSCFRHPRWWGAER